MFSEWLEDQMTRNDEVGVFARTAWDDYTSGCARWYANALAWRDHFNAKHPKTAEKLVEMLVEAYTVYASTLKQPTA